MSADTMAAHDDGIEEAKEIVRAEFPLNCGSAYCSVGAPFCPECTLLRNKRRRVLAALTRVKEQR